MTLHPVTEDEKYSNYESVELMNVIDHIVSVKESTINFNP